MCWSFCLAPSWKVPTLSRKVLRVWRVHAEAAFLRCMAPFSFREPLPSETLRETSIPPLLPRPRRPPSPATHRSSNTSKSRRLERVGRAVAQAVAQTQSARADLPAAARRRPAAARPAARPAAAHPAAAAQPARPTVSTSIHFGYHLEYTPCCSIQHWLTSTPGLPFPFTHSRASETKIVAVS